MTGTTLRALLLCLGLLAVHVDARAAAPASAIAGRLASPPVLRGQFEQEKQLRGFRNPLLSRGDFVLAKDRGLLWTTRSPFASTLVLTRQHLLVRQADGGTRTLGDTKASPAVSTTNALLMALLAGDTEALSRQFVLSETVGADGSWRLQLVPKAGALKKVFARIELQGDRYVRSVRLDEVRGDRTDIRFTQLRDTPVALSADEASQLE